MTEQVQRPRVVVGVDDSPTARQAVAFAVREAALRGATLDAVMAIELPDYAWIDPYHVRDHSEVDYLRKTEDTLRSILAEVGTAAIDVQPVVMVMPAATALIQRSADAELLVVGSRGRGGFHGMLMGSVSLQCVLHAHCPVTVVRPEPHQHEAADKAATVATHPQHRLEDTRAQTTATFL